MRLERTFVQGTMNKNADVRVLPPGQVRTLINGRVSTSEGSDVGALENCLGNEILTSLVLGANATSIGVGWDVSINKIFWLTKSDDRCCFIEYDISSDTATKVLEDTRTGSSRILNLSENFLVNKISIIVDTDNDNVYATWTDNNDPVRFVNIARAKTYGTNGFGQDEISLIKKPPLHRPEITLQNSSVSEENHIEELLLRFSYRYKYLDGELSAPSPFSLVAFEAKPFNYNFSTNTNESMVNRYNEVEVEFNTGSNLVKEVEILVREDLSNLLVVVESYNKSDEGWSDDTAETITYSRKKIKSILGIDQLSRLFDAVPHKAGELEVISSEIVLGNITEEFDIVDDMGDRIPMDFSLDYNTNTITAPGASKSVKTIRDYTAAIVYVDDYGRSTVPLTCKDAEIFIKGSDMTKQCLLELTINHLAPPFAAGYRIFIKQSRDDYDIITPPLFYRDGVYAWLKLESGEQDKINEGDYLIVKADTQGVKESYIETRVLEITTKERNFLEGDQTITTIEQVPGLYFKIKVGNNFRIAPEDFVLYEWYAFDNISGGIDNPIIGSNTDVVEPAIYYGSIGLDDITTGGTYTDSSNDRRYIVEITAVGTPDTFRWSDDNGSNWTSGVTITGAAQALSHGVTITFGATTGHDITDQWKFSAHGSTTDSLGSFEGNQTYTIIQGPNDPEDDTIYANASITIVVLQRRDGQPDIRVEHTLTSSTTYANIEEWYWGDNVASTIDAATNFDAVWFRRGNATGGTSGNNGFQQDSGGLMCMIIRGQYTVNPNSGFATTEVNFSVFQNENLMLFETKSEENQTEQYWETGPTYLISSEGYHLGNGVSDTDQSSGVAAVLDLDFFNCFSWGNGFESYKIKDSLSGNKMSFYVRSLVSLDEYGQNIRKSSFTWGRQLEQSTNYNGLNEFNRSLNNSIDLDDAKGSIQRMFNRDTDLFIAQEHRLQPIGFRKTQIFDQSGNPSIVKSDTEFSIFRAYAGEYGISQDPLSFAVFGYRIYMSDRKRGTPLRLSIDGVTELSIHDMDDYFKDLYRENEDAKIIGGYDPYFDEYLLTVVRTSGTSYTIGFSERNKGWVSLYSYVPEQIIGINNRLYTLKNGQLWLHNSETVSRNNFYGTQYSTEVEVIFNDIPTHDKILKSIILDSNIAWDIEIESNLAFSTIGSHEFVNKESKFYAYVRGNETEEDLSDSNVHGTGVINYVDGLTVRFPEVNEYASTNDQLWQVNSGVPELVGAIGSINGNIITLSGAINAPVVGRFCYIKKNSRIDGGKMRGYYFKVKLTSDSEDFAELYAVQAEIVKSYVE